MMEIVKADRRHFSDAGWLQSHWLFSFSDYHDPANVRWGSLRVFNDDVVAPGTGFPMHPHRDMEIVTLVLRGEVTHRDSMGNRAVIGAGDVQRMSAGAGLTHSEHNLGAEPCHLYQIWIIPERRGLTPSYDQRTFDPGDRRNRLHAVASGRGDAGAVTLNADAVIHRCDLEAGRAVTHEAAAGRRRFVYVKEGRLLVDGRELDANDQARIGAAGVLAIEARERADFVLIEVPA